MNWLYLLQNNRQLPEIKSFTAERRASGRRVWGRQGCGCGCSGQFQCDLYSFTITTNTNDLKIAIWKRIIAPNCAKINVFSTGRFSVSRLRKSKRLCWGRRRRDTARTRRFYVWCGENTNKCWPMKNQPRICTMIIRDFNRLKTHSRLSQLELKLKRICWRYRSFFAAWWSHDVPFFERAYRS